MMDKYCIIVLLLCVTFISGCTPYDSDAVNKHLLQGYWRLDGIYYETDSTILAYPIQDTSVFFFKNDSCYFHRTLTDSVIKYRYEVNNYKITTYLTDSDTLQSNGRDILLLSNDTLILGMNRVQWEYVKVKNQPQ